MRASSPPWGEGTNTSMRASVLVRVAFDPVKDMQTWTIRAIACSRFALGILATQHGPLALRMLAQNLIDEPGYGNVAALFDIERPLAPALKVALLQLFQKPANERVEYDGGCFQ